MLTIRDPDKVDWAKMPLGEMSVGNAEDTFFTLKIFEILEKKLEEYHIFPFITYGLSPILPIFSDIEKEGMDIDTDNLKVLDKELKDVMIEKEDAIYSLPKVPGDTNLNSPKDLVGILYTNEDGYCLYPPDRTNKGEPSTNAECLETLLELIGKELTKRG